MSPLWIRSDAPQPCTSARSRAVVLRLASLRYSDLREEGEGTLAGTFDPSRSAVPMSPTARIRTRSADATGAGGAAEAAPAGTAAAGGAGEAAVEVGEAASVRLLMVPPLAAARLGNVKKEPSSRAVATGPGPRLSAGAAGEADCLTGETRPTRAAGEEPAGKVAVRAAEREPGVASETGGPKAEKTAPHEAGSQPVPPAALVAFAAGAAAPPQVPESPYWK